MNSGIRVNGQKYSIKGYFFLLNKVLRDIYWASLKLITLAVQVGGLKADVKYLVLQVNTTQPLQETNTLNGQTIPICMLTQAFYAFLRDWNTGKIIRTENLTLWVDNYEFNRFKKFQFFKKYLCITFLAQIQSLNFNGDTQFYIYVIIFVH